MRNTNILFLWKSYIPYAGVYPDGKVRTEYFKVRLLVLVPKFVSHHLIVSHTSFLSCGVVISEVGVLRYNFIPQRYGISMKNNFGGYK